MLFDESAVLRLDFVLTKRQWEPELCGPATALLPLDLQERQSTVEVVTNTHLVPRHSTTTMRMIEVKLHRVEVNTVVARPGGIAREQQQMLRLQQPEQVLQAVRSDQILAIEPLLQRP